MTKKNSTVVVCTFPKARSNFVNTRALNNMHVGSIHLLCQVFSQFHTFSCSSDPQNAAQAEKKGSILEPILRFGPSQKIAKGPFRSKKLAPKEPIPSFVGEPEGSELAGHPVLLCSHRETDRRQGVGVRHAKKSRPRRLHQSVRLGVRRF